jgi:perosamine synthetase
MPMYETQENFPIADSLGSRGINLPSWPGLTNEQVVFISEKIKKYFAL